MISHIMYSLKPSQSPGFLKGEAQNIYVRYLKVLTPGKTENKIKTEMKLSILIFIKPARISPAAFQFTFVNSLVQNTY